MQYEKTNQPQRLFTMFAYQAESWPQSRQVAVKCEAGPNGTNRRAVVSNRPGITVLPGGVYDEYADRGESENRNKELKCEFCIDRLSDQRYMANCCRMFLHCLAYTLLLAMRHRIASPPEQLPRRTRPALIWNRRRCLMRFLPRRRRGVLVAASSIVVVKRIPWAKDTPAPGG